MFKIRFPIYPFAIESRIKKQSSLSLPIPNVRVSIYLVGATVGHFVAFLLPTYIKTADVRLCNIAIWQRGKRKKLIWTCIYVIPIKTDLKLGVVIDSLTWKMWLVDRKSDSSKFHTPYNRNPLNNLVFFSERKKIK